MCCVVGLTPRHLDTLWLDPGGSGLSLCDHAELLQNFSHISSDPRVWTVNILFFYSNIHSRFLFVFTFSCGVSYDLWCFYYDSSQFLPSYLHFMPFIFLMTFKNRKWYGSSLAWLICERNSITIQIERNLRGEDKSLFNLLFYLIIQKIWFWLLLSALPVWDLGHSVSYSVTLPSGII